MSSTIPFFSRFLWIFLNFLVFSSPSILQASVNEPTSINIGVLSAGSKDQCFDQWRPTAEYLEGALSGYSAHIICLDYSEVEKAVYDGLVDFTISNPALYINLEYIFGASRIATLKGQGGNAQSTQFGGVLFKKADRKDMPTIAELKGKRFAAVAPMSFGGWLVGWRHLKQHGIDPFKDFKELTFLGQQDKVVQAVQSGIADAGTVRTGTLELMASEGQINLKDFDIIDQQFDDLDSGYGIIDPKLNDQSFPYVHTTQLYPQWVLAKIQHVDVKLAERVMFAFMQIEPSSCQSALNIDPLSASKNDPPKAKKKKSIASSEFESSNQVS